MSNFIDCENCDAVVRSRHEQDGLCRACYALEHPDESEMVTVPTEVLRRLVSMRHPSVCNEDAPMFERVLVQQVEGYTYNREELGDDH